jgi:hypothetical protein
MSASRTVDVSPRPLAFYRPALVNRFTLAVRLPFAREPSALVEQFCEVGQNL